MSSAPGMVTADGGDIAEFVQLAAEDVTAVTYANAARAIRQALHDGFDVTAAPARSVVPVDAGQLLLMPGEYDRYVAVKVVSLAMDNPRRGLPRVQGRVLLMTRDTLTPVALLDGITLTTLRTASVSVAAAPEMVGPGPVRVVMFGAGPQAEAHIRALHQTATLADVAVISRTAGHVSHLASRLAAELRVPVRPGDREDLACADVVVTATTARSPLFGRGDIRPDACLIAVGSHEPDAQEFDPALLADAQVVVENPATTAREGGEVVAACAAGHLRVDQLASLTDLVTGAATIDRTRLRVFKTVGMAWEDVVVAAAVYENYRERSQ